MLNNTMKSLKTKKSLKKGFTLMEMLIVVAIIAILVAIAIPTFTSSLNKARLAADKANLRTAYAEAFLDYMDDEKLNKSKYKYGDTTITASVDAGKITTTITAGAQCTSSDAVKTYTDGTYGK